MNELLINILMTLLTTLAVSCACMLIYTILNEAGIKNPELALLYSLIIALAKEYKDKILKDNK